MTVRQSTHIRFLNGVSSLEKIIQIKFIEDTVETIEQVVKNIDEGDLYYYLCNDGQSPSIKVVHPYDGQAPYIKTRISLKIRDGLLNLPIF